MNLLFILGRINKKNIQNLDGIKYNPIQTIKLINKVPIHRAASKSYLLIYCNRNILKSPVEECLKGQEMSMGLTNEVRVDGPKLLLAAV